MKPVLATALLALVMFSAGCGDPEAIALTQQDVARLRADVDDLGDELEKVRDELAKERRRGSDRVRRVEPAAPAPLASSAPAAAADDSDATGTVDPQSETSTITANQFTEFLSTESGQEVFTAAMRSYQRKQSDDRQRRVVEALVAPFAKKAALSDTQKERMTDIMLDVSQQTRDAWASMRDVAPEKRGEQVMVNIQRSREIRDEADAAVAQLLSTAQYTIFEEEAAVLYGMPQPPRRDDGNGNR